MGQFWKEQTLFNPRASLFEPKDLFLTHEPFFDPHTTHLANPETVSSNLFLLTHKRQQHLERFASLCMQKLTVIMTCFHAEHLLHVLLAGECN